MIKPKLVIKCTCGNMIYIETTESYGICLKCDNWVCNTKKIFTTFKPIDEIVKYQI